MIDKDKLIRKEYMGDGVYVGFDIFIPQIWAWTERYGVQHEIAFDVETSASFRNYIQRVYTTTLTDAELAQLDYIKNKNAKEE